MKKRKNKKITVRERELKRVKQIIYREKKKGLVVKITSSDLEKMKTSELKKIKPITIRKHSSGYWQGEKVTGVEFEKKRKKEMSLKRKQVKRGVIQMDTSEWERGFTEKVLDTLYELCRQYDSSIDYVERYGASLLKDMLDEEIQKYGRKAVAYSAEQSAQVNMSAGEEIIFASKEIHKQSNLDILRMNIRGALPSKSELDNDKIYDEYYYSMNEQEDELY